MVSSCTYLFMLTFYLLTCTSSFKVRLVLSYVSNTWCLFSGAVRLQTPLLLPRNRKLYDGSELACFMDHSGMLVTLPFDLRVSPLHAHTQHTHTYRRACLHLHTSTNYTTICISTCKRTHSVRLQSAAALRSCYFRKP